MQLVQAHSLATVYPNGHWAILVSRAYCWGDKDTFGMVQQKTDGNGSCSTWSLHRKCICYNIDSEICWIQVGCHRPTRYYTSYSKYECTQDLTIHIFIMDSSTCTSFHVQSNILLCSIWPYEVLMGRITGVPSQGKRSILLHQHMTLQPSIRWVCRQAYHKNPIRTWGCWLHHGMAGNRAQ